MNKVSSGSIKRNLFKVFPIVNLGVILLPFSHEPIQADDLSGFATVIQINSTSGVLEGLKNWIALQFQSSSHFVPFGWSFQWFQYTFVDFLSKIFNGNFILFWRTTTLILLVSLTYFAIRNFISGIAKLAQHNDPKLIDLRCSFVSLIFGALVTIHSPWSIDPFASHLAYGLLTTFLFSIVFRLTTEIILKNNDANSKKELVLFGVISTLGLCTYDLFISLLFVSTILAMLYVRYVLTTRKLQIIGKISLSVIGIIYPVAFFTLTRLLNQVPEYPGTKLLINLETIKAVFSGMASTFQPIGTIRAIQGYNLPISLHISAILASFFLISQLLIFTKFANMNNSYKSKRDIEIYTVIYFVVISLAVVATQVFNERWGPYIAQLGNIYLFYSTTLLLAVCLIGHLTFSSFLEKDSKILQVVMTSILITLSVVSTSTNWTLLKRDVRNPGTLLIAIGYEDSSSEGERCAAEFEFLKIGYPEPYSSLVLNSVRSFGSREIGVQFCDNLEVKEP